MYYKRLGMKTCSLNFKTIHKIYFRYNAKGLPKFLDKGIENFTIIAQSSVDIAKAGIEKLSQIQTSNIMIKKMKSF